MKIDIDKITEAELVRGQRWTVAPGLLSKIKPVSAAFFKVVVASAVKFMPPSLTTSPLVPG